MEKSGGVIPDWRIRELAKQGMIYPFVDEQIREVPLTLESVMAEKSRRRVISYGLSSFGYDIRVADEFRIFTNNKPGIIDPKNFGESAESIEFHGDICILPPNSFALARSVEYFKIPRNVITVSINKSTYARCGVFCNITAFEPEWEGHVTIEISNMAPLPAKVYANEGIAQILFFEGLDPEVSYRDKKGVYQGQVGITFPIVGEA